MNIKIHISEKFLKRKKNNKSKMQLCMNQRIYMHFENYLEY